MAKTKSYHAKYEFLRHELMKDFWVVGDAMELLCGWIKMNVNPEGRIAHDKFYEWFPLFETEQKLPNRDQFKRMRDIWEASEHDFFQNDFRNVDNRDSLEIRVSHLIEWADSKKIKIPWRGWAEEMELLQENAPDPIPKKKPMGKKKEDNLYRLLSIMGEMMINPDKKSHFKNTTDMITYISDEYEEHEPKNSGLGDRTLQREIAKATTVRPIQDPEPQDEQ